MSSPRSIVFVSLERWDHIWRRNQFLCAGLARRGWKIIFVEPARDVTYAIRSRTWSELQRGSSRPGDGTQGVMLARPNKWMPSSLGIGRRVNEWAMTRRVMRSMRDLDDQSPVLWINDHSAVGLVDRIKHGRLIYDVTDDWTSFQVEPAVMRRISDQDRQLCQRADAVIVCSEKLQQMKREQAGERVHLIPNGVEVKHYLQVDDPASAPAEAQSWPQPVFMYTGTVHPQRLDVELTLQIATRMTRGTIVLLGPQLLSVADRQRLLATGRVVLKDAVAYRDLPAWMSAAKAFVVPHLRSEFVESLNPIKLWEYLAAGKPIVSSDVPGFREQSEVVRIARSAVEFSSMMEAALEEGEALKDRRRAIAAENAWEQRIDCVEEILSGKSVDRGNARKDVIRV
jgi:teichuronic acid biosynthesis glycosyltransferase TuaH